MDRQSCLINPRAIIVFFLVLNDHRLYILAYLYFPNNTAILDFAYQMDFKSKICEKLHFKFHLVTFEKEFLANLLLQMIC